MSPRPPARWASEAIVSCARAAVWYEQNGKPEPIDLRKACEEIWHDLRTDYDALLTDEQIRVSLNRAARRLMEATKEPA